MLGRAALSGFANFVEQLLTCDRVVLASRVFRDIPADDLIRIPTRDLARLVRITADELVRRVSSINTARRCSKRRRSMVFAAWST